MISSADFNRSLFGSTGDFSTANRTRRGASNAGRAEANDVVSGRSHDRQWANLMSASGQLNGRLRAVSRGRRHAQRTTGTAELLRGGRSFLRSVNEHSGLTPWGEFVSWHWGHAEG